MSLSAVSGRTSDTIENLRRAAASCQACPLWKDALQTVFGEGPAMLQLCSLASKPAMQEIVKDGRSDAYWTKRWRTRE